MRLLLRTQVGEKGSWAFIGVKAKGGGRALDEVCRVRNSGGIRFKKLIPRGAEGSRPIDLAPWRRRLHDGVLTSQSNPGWSASTIDEAWKSTFADNMAAASARLHVAAGELGFLAWESCCLDAVCFVDQLTPLRRHVFTLLKRPVGAALRDRPTPEGSLSASPRDGVAVHGDGDGPDRERQV